jgi:glutamyl-tRNA synthetase
MITPDMITTVRFAPSPTGLLHVGNARMALMNWLFARRHEGRFILRIDDTDTERSEETFVEAIRGDLQWLGLEWDEFVRQSQRLDRYQAAFDRLREEGLIYPCYETPEELEFKRRRLLARRRPPIYDRAALALSAADRSRLEAGGRRPHWRFLLAHDSIEWTDLVRGPQHFEGTNLSDPVLVRADGTYLYMLPSIVDDIDCGVTHVIRGEDHVVNAAVQIQLFRALGAEPPQFAHLPLLTDIAGKGLSKRHGSISLKSLRDAGIEPMALNSSLASLGTSERPEPHRTLDEIASRFDISVYGRATPKFDESQLWHMNSRLLQQLPFEAVAARLKDMGLDEADARFWEAVRANLARLGDAADWYAVCYGEMTPVIVDADLVSEAAARLPPEPWTEETWTAWTRALKAATGRKGKELFLPLRLALTGVSHGPELRLLLPVIGRERALRRLTSRADVLTSAEALPPFASEHFARKAGT